MFKLGKIANARKCCKPWQILNLGVVILLDVLYQCSTLHIIHAWLMVHASRGITAPSNKVFEFVFTDERISIYQ